MRRVVLTLILLITAAAAEAQVNDIRSVLRRANQAAGRQAVAEMALPAADCGAISEALEEAGDEAPVSDTPLSRFGAGIGAVSSLGDDRIETAELVDDKIVVTADDDVSLGAIMEVHALRFVLDSLWAVRDDDGRLYVTRDKPCEAATEFPTIAHGPFAALSLGDEEVIKGVGIGWMIGFRIRETDSSLNIGLAYMLQDDAKTLADGFNEGDPLPGGDEIKYRTGRGSALALVISFGF
jgi:hypothetical protein